MKRSVWLSVGLSTLIVAWMLSGTLTNARTNPEPEAEPVRETPLMKVQVETLEPRAITRQVVVQGQLEPVRRVQIRAETAGQVVELPVERGELVKAGDVIVALAEDDRLAQIARSEAEVAARRLDVDGNRKLFNKGLQGESQLKAAEAALAAAQADLEQKKIDLGKTRILAPFTGALESRDVEYGSLLERGDVVAEVVDQSSLLAVGQIPQRSVHSITLGQPISVRLLDGREAEGIVTFVSAVAETGTRSFRVEASIANTGDTLPAGVSAEIRISVGDQTAHFISPATLTLNDSGQVGVKSVSPEGQVTFHAIDLVRTEANGVWVSGLEGNIQVITRGQGFVVDGQRVEVVAL